MLVGALNPFAHHLQQMRHGVLHHNGQFMLGGWSLAAWALSEKDFVIKKKKGCLQTSMIHKEILKVCATGTLFSNVRVVVKQHENNSP